MFRCCYVIHRDMKCHSFFVARDRGVSISLSTNMARHYFLSWSTSNLAFFLFLVFVCVFSLEVYYTTSVTISKDNLANWQQRTLLQYGPNHSLDFQQKLSSTSTSNVNRACSRNNISRPTIQSLSSFFTTNYTTEKFTIIVPTYKRNYCLYTILRHYCKMKHVAQIIVLWNNIGEKIPRYLTKQKCRSAVKFMKMAENRMTTRYILYPEIKTEAILALDDDRIVTEESLMLAYRTWKKFRHKIIGFCSRTFINDSNGQYIYKPDGRRFPYSLILPNAAFIHRNYLEMFSNSLPRKLYNFIDEHMNVDDIAMNAMIADFLNKVGEPQCSGFLVNGNMTACRVTGSEFKGLWHRPNHNEVRTEYLWLVNRTYGYMPLVECDIAISHIGNTH